MATRRAAARRAPAARSRARSIAVRAAPRSAPSPPSSRRPRSARRPGRRRPAARRTRRRRSPRSASAWRWIDRAPRRDAGAGPAGLATGCAGASAPRRAMTDHERIETDGVPIRAWVRGVHVDDNALQQLKNVALLPIVHGHVAAMPDVHWGIGATVGSVIPTKGAIIPAAVGVDIGCGMMAVQTDLNARDLPDHLKGIRTAIEKAVPHGRTNHGGRSDVGAWREIPTRNNE